ncbi:hypothetical protein DD237_007686 [Peronospora effusa]|uniref:Uncharacterized protein n=1 Tax=Peronospora effusa TaxID=542832 RepID=A0A425C5M7_9STRA|nr:hypothetical protein DD237_007686 [Peronospora effusa]
MVNVLNEYANANTTRNINKQQHTIPRIYDEKNDMKLLRTKLERRKKPIYAGLILLAVVLVGVTVGVSSSSSSTANTESAQKDPSVSSSNDPSVSSSNDPSVSSSNDLLVSSLNDATSIGQYDLDAGVVQVERDSVSDADRAELDSSNDSKNIVPVVQSSLSTSSSKISSTKLTQSEIPLQNSSGHILTYRLVDFVWTDASKWEYVNGETVSSDMVTPSGIKLTPENSEEPIRTKEGWSGEKVVFIEWERTSTSDTNIWMLNTKLQSHFGKGNGWPYWGEIDLFEMFKQDAINTPAYDYSGFGGFSDVSSYGQMTMHMGPATENGKPCFCPASPSKNLWYDNTQPMTSGCAAQFSNDLSNSIAAVWGSDSTGKYIQLIQKPTITKGGMLNGAETYDVTTGSGGVTSKIYNNAQLFWGVDATDSCAKAGGHDAASGFPFFESFRLILEEQTKGDASASFTVKNIQIFTKN